MEIKAYAKINLTLDVIRKREDGYHELEMIMVPIDLYDDISIELSNTNIIEFNGIVLDDNNTVSKSLKFLEDNYGLKDCYKICINKNIPSCAGLAGGSSDAAAVINAIIKLSNIKCNYDEIVKASSIIGADVPFCMMETPCLVKGIGEIVVPINIKNMYVLIVKPNEGVSTGKCFSMVNYDSNNNSDITKVIEEINNNNFKEAIKYANNDLEIPAFKLLHDIEDIKNKLLSYGLDYVLMSGSGSSVFALSDNINILNEIKTNFDKSKYFLHCCKIIGGNYGQ